MACSLTPTARTGTTSSGPNAPGKRVTFSKNPKVARSLSFSGAARQSSNTWGYFIPSHADEALPWLVPPLHARFLGAMYFSGTTSEHVQLNQEERFEIASGAARYRLSGAERQATPGEVVVIPRGLDHVNCWPEGPEALHVRHSFRPALGADDFFETLFALARLDKTNAKGEVNLLQLAVIGSETESQTYAAGIPVSLQRLALPVLASLGRLLGYQAHYRYPKLP